MNRFMQSIRYHANAVISRLRSFFPLSTTQLLWGLGATFVLLPVAAHAWWRYDSAMADDRSSQDAMLRPERPTPAKADAKLHVDADGADIPSPEDASHSPKTTIHTETSVDDQANVQLQVNGQQIPLPSKGTVHKEISDGAGNTNVDISIRSDTSGTSESDSHTSMNIDLNSSTRTESSSGD